MKFGKCYRLRKRSVPKSIVHINYHESALRLEKNPALLSYKDWGIILEALEDSCDPADASEDSYLIAGATKELFDRLMMKGKPENAG